MVQWITSSGFLGNVTKGESFQFSLNANTGNAPLTSFSLLAGSLPIGLSLSSPTNNPTLSYPTIFGVTSLETNTGLYEFSVRATDGIGNLADRSFNLNVLDVVPSYVFPNSNLGVFPDGAWTFTSVAPLQSVPLLTGNIQIVSGSLPGNLSLDSNTGAITGYINPNVLYNTPAIFINAESSAPKLHGSANSKTFSFTVQYDVLNQENYSITVQRADQYANANANVSGPVYHPPIFTNATFEEQAGSTPNINLGLIDGGKLLFQFDSFDYEGNTPKFALINGNVIPGDVVINPTTGWLSGYVNRDLSTPSPYNFQVTVEKFINISHRTTAFCTLTVDNPADNSIVWNSPNNLGNILPGIPSSISINASIVEPFSSPLIRTAIANCTMQLVNVTIVNGGNAFSNGSIFSVPGGIFGNAANIIVSNVSANGSITSVLIDPSIVQQYTEIPQNLTVIWQNETGNANALNAIFDLSFGVESINILDGGGFYDTVTIGFTPVGESNSAIASALIYNGTIVSGIVDEMGNGYPAVPEVVIHGKARITPTNPIKYDVTAGNIPTGLKLLSNGLLVGVPSMQIFQNPYTFTVTASIGQNSNIQVVEEDLPITEGNNSVYQDFQTLVTSSQTFTLGLDTANLGLAPRTNLSLDFLLDPTDLNTVLSPLHDQSIIPNGQIFRQSDCYFGVVDNVRMLLAYGISPVIPDQIQYAIAEYFHNKTYTFTDLRWAQSTTENYEIIYIEALDEFTTANGVTFSGYITYNTPEGEEVAFPATLPNMIEQLNTHLNGFDYRFLPTWMTDYQPDGKILGYIPAIPLIYCQPGTGMKIMYYLQEAYGNSLANISAVTDRLIWNSGIQQNWNPLPIVTVQGTNNVANIANSANSNFYINPAVPVTFTPNLTPRTYAYSGNIEVNLPTNITSLSNVVNIINNLFIDGITASLNGNFVIQIQNTFGAPFLLYDGTNTPLANLGILPFGTGFANIANVIPATWYVNEFTSFDQGEEIIITESLSDILTELGNVIITESSTAFTDIPIFYDNSDTFECSDDNATYILFPLNDFIPIQVVGV